jgi:hypothetical protein
MRLGQAVGPRRLRIRLHRRGRPHSGAVTREADIATTLRVDLHGFAPLLEELRTVTTASDRARVGTETDIAKAAAFLLGLDSAFLVDGGVTAAVMPGAFSNQQSLVISHDK